ncbi:MAG TPA: hypothetical protein PLG55_12320, partial [Methanospirillum sp.]|uniref:hypothetical protein n=1 Tax=Methanospirillum sp. TaxID=45200 RepID=UPI002CE48590
LLPYPGVEILVGEIPELLRYSMTVGTMIGMDLMSDPLDRNRRDFQFLSFIKEFCQVSLN